MNISSQENFHNVVSDNGIDSSNRNHLHLTLSRVLSERVLKIIACSQQQLDFEKNRIKNSNNSNSDTTIIIPNEISSPEIKKEKKFVDKSSLIEYCIRTYDDVLAKCAPIVQSAKAIVNSILNYSKENDKESDIDSQITVDKVLSKYFLKNILDLKRFYTTTTNPTSEQFKIESQLQIILKLENYIISKNVNGKIEVDGDFVWEIANSIKWMGQLFKENFKIEKFLFGELYPCYYATAPELVQSLMEELGFYKKDNLCCAHSIRQNVLSSNTLTLNLGNSSKSPSNISINFKTVTETIKSILEKSSKSAASNKDGIDLNYLDYGDDSSRLLVSCLFKSKENVKKLEKQTVNSQFNVENNLLSTPPKKKKIKNRFYGFSLINPITNRSIFVHSKKMKLKIRSPYKSPSKSVPKSKDILLENQKIQMKLCKMRENLECKRPNTYLITDTPDEKQHSTIIMAKQEYLKRKFSWYGQLNSGLLPIVPDTPIKKSTI